LEQPTSDPARLAEECAELWRLRLGKPFAYAFASIAMPATREDGSEVVLKIQRPHRESDQEAEALRAWDGRGAVRLLAHDRRRHALLIERCLPGDSLAERDSEEALGVLIGLLPRLSIPVETHVFRSLADEAAWWASSLRRRWESAGRPYEERILEAALDILRDLPAAQGELVLVNQDLHPGNVLAAQREPWLVIDPKPLAGEREFALAPVIRATELGHGPKQVLHRLDRLTSELGLDRERARLWCVAQTLAWSIDETVLQTHLDTARWLLDSR
jgi:streptomycin 6-kinase